MYSGKDYWKNYMEKWFGKELIEKCEKHVIIEEIQSNSRKIKIEIYVLQSKPYKRHEDYTKPVLVVQPENDNMTPPYYTEKVYKKLGSEKKSYVEIKDALHFPTEKKYYTLWAEEVDNFLKSVW